MKDYIELFKNYLTDVKKSSNNTVESYMRDISQFSSYCTAEGVKDLADVNTEFLQQYSAFLKGKGKSDSTVLRITASLRCYYRYLVSQNIVSSNPTEKLKTPKTEKKLPGVLTSNEIILLLSKTDGVDFKSIRDKAMLELLYATGIKVTELIELSVNDINLQVGIIHLKKGGKERIIPIYPAALKSLSNYIENVRPAIVLEPDEERLFTNMNGQSMSRQGFWKIIKHYAQIAGIDKEITPHTLRHSFAAHLLENGAKLSDIKEMLGHSDISSTQIYARLMKSKYSSAYSKFHPLAK